MTYKEYLLSEQWQERRKRVFSRALENANSNNKYGVCERCGYEPKKHCLQVHHKTYANLFNELMEDLELLCPNCHKKETEKQIVNRKELELKERILKSMQERKIEFEIKENISVLSQEDKPVKKELNIVSWNGANAVYDLRSWGNNEDGTKKPLKGMTLTTEEVKCLREVLNKLEIA